MDLQKANEVHKKLMASLNKHRASSDGGFYIYDDIELEAAF